MPALIGLSQRAAPNGKCESYLLGGTSSRKYPTLTTTVCVNGVELQQIAMEYP